MSFRVLTVFACIYLIEWSAQPYLMVRAIKFLEGTITLGCSLYFVSLAFRLLNVRKLLLKGHRSPASSYCRYDTDNSKALCSEAFRCRAPGVNGLAHFPSSCFGDVEMFDSARVDGNMEHPLHKIAVQIRIMQLPCTKFVMYMAFKHGGN